MAALEQVVDPAQIRRERVGDLWPLGLIRRRMGLEAAQVSVITPATYEEVAQVLRWASGTRTVVVPMGAGTGVCGAIAPADRAVVLDLRRLNRVLEVDEMNLTCRAQAGIIGLDLENQLLARGLTLGHYPSSLPISTLGGLISTRSSGQQSTYAGNIEDMLLGAVVVLADGSILPLRPPMRSAVGPALHQLFAGAEGSLGVIVEAQLRLQRIPELTVGRGFAFDSLAGGLRALREVMQRGIRPLVMRLYDREDTAFQGTGVDGCLLVVAVAGEKPIAEASMEVIESIAASGTPLGEEPWEHWLEHRFDLSERQLRQFLEPAGSYVDTIEVAAPWSTIETLHAEVKAALAEASLALCHFSHAYTNGCCAYFTFGGVAGSDAEAVGVYERCWEATMEAVLRQGATCSHHHGVGQLRARWSRREMGEWHPAWLAIRDALDPNQILNANAMGGR